MSRRKKINKVKVAIVVFALLVFFMSVTGLGRFVYNAARDRYLSSKKFYFSSDFQKNAKHITYNFKVRENNKLVPRKKRCHMMSNTDLGVLARREARRFKKKKLPKIVAITGSIQASTAATPFSTYLSPQV